MNKKILSVVLILCVMLAVMPMTAYAADIAFCSKCNRIQTVRLTYQYSNDEWHICNVTCTVCNKYMVLRNVTQMERNGDLHKRKDMHGMRRIFRTAWARLGHLDAEQR